MKSKRVSVRNPTLAPVATLVATLPAREAIQALLAVLKIHFGYFRSREG